MKRLVALALCSPLSLFLFAMLCLFLFWAAKVWVGQDLLGAPNCFDEVKGYC
jgi:hypothetical protein